MKITIATGYSDNSLQGGTTLRRTNGDKPGNPPEIPSPGKHPETNPSQEPEPYIWPQKTPEIYPGKEPLTTPPTAPPETPSRPAFGINSQ